MYERIPRERVHYVFEEGESRTEQQALTDLMLEDGFPRPDFRWKKDCVIHGHPHQGFTPLQAADILAWHLYQIQKDWVSLPEAQRTTDAALRICRLPFPELESLPETPRKITPGDLQKYIESRAYMDLRRKLIAAQGDPFNLESL